MATDIKICGLTRAVDAEFADAAQPDVPPVITRVNDCAAGAAPAVGWLKISVEGATGLFSKLDMIAATIARSAAGSSTSRPPTTLR